MIPIGVVAVVLFWLLKPRSSPSVTVGEDYSVVFEPRGDGAPWSDAYKAKPGDPP
jgi:hypothetical protein